MEEEEATGQQLTILDLPHEMVLYVFRDLLLEDVLSVMLVCFRWSVLAQDDSLWKSLYPTHFPIPLPGALCVGLRMLRVVCCVRCVAR